MKLLTLIALSILVACSSPATTDSGSGNQIRTAARGRLVDDIKRDLEGDHNRFHPECRFTKVISASPLSKDSEYTYETWVIEACSGKQFSYKVMIQFGNENNFVMISRMDIPVSGVKP